MSFGVVLDLYVIGRELYSSFFTEDFRNTDIYIDYISAETFSREIESGSIDASKFSDTFETYDITDLTFKLSPSNSSEIDIELKYSGSITFNKASSSDSYFSSFSSNDLIATIQITDTRNGENNVLTDLFTFDQINISGTGYFETVNDLININLGKNEVNLRLDSLDIDYASKSNEAVKIEFDIQTKDNYTVTKTIDGTLIDTSDVGLSSFTIKGSNDAGDVLTLNEDAQDPDLEGSYSYSWKVSTDYENWTEVGAKSSYTIKSDDIGKAIRAEISYEDKTGFTKEVTTQYKELGDFINIYVDPIGLSSPYYKFYLDRDKTTELPFSKLDTTKEYKFITFSENSSHPFYISTGDYGKPSDRSLVTIKGDGGVKSGIKAGETFILKFKDHSVESIKYFCTSHSSMDASFDVSTTYSLSQSNLVNDLDNNALSFDKDVILENLLEEIWLNFADSELTKYGEDLLALDADYKNTSGTLEIQDLGTDQVRFVFTDFVYQGDYLYKGSEIDTVNDFYSTNTFNGTITFNSSGSNLSAGIYPDASGELSLTSTLNLKDTDNNIINKELSTSLEVKIDSDIKFTDEDIEIEGPFKIDFKYDLEGDDKPEVNLSFERTGHNTYTLDRVENNKLITTETVSPKFTFINTDFTGESLWKDSNNYVYIDDNTSESHLKVIKNSWSDDPSSDLIYSYSDDYSYDDYTSIWSSSTSPIAVTKDEDGEVGNAGDYLVLIGESSYSYWDDSYMSSPSEYLYENWRIAKIDSNDLIYDWDNIWINSKDELAQYEKVFGQDLNDDNFIGEPEINVNDLYEYKLDNDYVIYTNTSTKDWETYSYLLPGNDSSNTLIKLSHEYGGHLSLFSTNEYKYDYSNYSYESNSYTKPIVGIEIEDGFKLITEYKSETTYSNDYYADYSYQSWTIYEIDKKGKIDWNDTTYVNTQNDLMSYEKEFNYDLNNDGSIGIDLSSLELKLSDTDTYKTRLARDKDDKLYIATEDGEYIKIKEQYGGDIYWEYEWSYDYGSSISESSSKALFVEKFDNNTSEDATDDLYYVLVKSSYYNSYDEFTYDEENWSIYKVDLDGTFSWSSYDDDGNYVNNQIWNPYIPEYESLFNEDINEDGFIGFNADLLEKVSTDTFGTELYRSEKNLFIKEGSDYLRISDKAGYSLEEYSYESSDYSYSNVGYAVEKNDDGGYYFAFKYTSENSGNEYTSWNVYTLDANGKYTWNDVQYLNSIADSETLFKQDLNGDNLIGINISALNKVSSDTTGYRLLTDDEGATYIWDGVDSSSLLTVKESYGYQPNFNYSYSYEYDNYSYSYSSEAKAAEYINESNESYYLLAVIYKNSNTYDGVTTSDQNWQVYKISEDGTYSWSDVTYTNSITTYEDEFGQDLNGDGDFSGIVELTRRDSDTVGTYIASESDGGDLYIVDGSEQIKIQDNWLEYESNWGDGSNSSKAIAVSDKNSDNQYKLALKYEYTYKDWFTDETTTSTSWNIYSIKDDGYIDWYGNSSIYAQSIKNYENLFGQDLDNDGEIGISISTLTSSKYDSNGWLLKKEIDSDGNTKGLYIVNNKEDESSLISIKDEWGYQVSLDWNSSWGYGSSSSIAQAVEKNTDGSFSLVVKSTNSYDSSSTSTDWTIYEISSDGTFKWNDSTYTADIKFYETSLFLDDLNDDGSVGIDFSKLNDISTDTFSETLKYDEDQVYYIYTPEGKYLPVIEEWGDPAKLSESYSWTDGDFSSTPVAVEETIFKNNLGESVNGYVIAIKNKGTYESESYEDWTLRYVDSDGVVDNSLDAWMQSIKSKESLFGTSVNDADLDGDGEIGLGINSSSLSSISTDEIGDLLKKDSSNSLYIVDDNNTSTDSSDDSLIAIIDNYGGTPNFDYSGSWGSGSYLQTYTSKTYAVEDITDDNYKYLLLIKNEDTYGGEKEISWETYKVDSDGVLDWNTGNYFKAIGKQESIFNQDIDGDSKIWSLSSALENLQEVTTDTSTTGNLAAALKKDSYNGLYISTSSSTIPIYQSSTDEITVNFDWTETWGGITNSSAAYAVEGIDSDDDSSIDKYKLLIKYTSKDNTDDTETINWESYEVSLAGIIDWSSETFGDGNLQEASINQDLNGDGVIWSISSIESNLTSITNDSSTDSTNVIPYLDSKNFLYIQDPSSSKKLAVIDSNGDSITFNQTISNGDYSYQSEVWAVEDIDTNSDSLNDSYKVLIKVKDTVGSDTVTYYESVNVDSTTLKVDWGSYLFHDDTNSLEKLFNQDFDNDGNIYELDINETNQKETDTTGALLHETNDGSLVILDGSTRIQITNSDGSSVDLDTTETWVSGASSGTFSTEALAIEKITESGIDKYKLVVEEKSVFGNESNYNYLIYEVSTAGILNWNNVDYKTATDLDETIFNQDISGHVTGDTSQNKGSTSESNSTFSSFVTSTNVDQETVQTFGDTAQSDIYSISNSDSSSTDSVEMFVKGIEGEGKKNYEMVVEVVQKASNAVIEKAASDTGLDSSDLEAVTDLTDFNITIPDSKNYGSIVSTTFVLPDDTTNPKYLKKNTNTGLYEDFTFDAETGEGAIWDSATKTFTVYVRDDGKYDSDSTPGVVRDPFFIASQKDKVNPTLSSSSPSDDSTNIDVTSDIKLTFSENVDIESGYITIKKSSDDSEFEKIDVTSTNQVKGTGTNVITINPASDFALATQYYVQIDSSAFDDSSSNSFAGISDKTSLSFTSAGLVDELNPTLSSSSPSDSSTNVDVASDIKLTFSENVDIESGYITIKKSSDDSEFEKIDVTSTTQVKGTGTNVITINPANTFASTTQYYVQIDSSAFDDSSSNSFAGISDKTSLSFTSADVVAPTLSSSSPSDDSTNVDVASDIKLTFSEVVQKGTGSVFIKKSTNNETFETIDVSSTQVSGFGTNVIKLNPSINFDSSTEYYVLINSSAFKDGSGNSFAGISKKKDLNFLTKDSEIPLLQKTSPSDNDTAVEVDSNIVLTFSENVDVETGYITIRKSSDDSEFEKIDVTSTTQVKGTGTNVITINPANTFASTTQYYVQIDSTAFDDSSSNSFAGISDKNSLNFTTKDIVAPTLSSSSPGDNSDSVSIDANIILNFSEIVNVSEGFISIKKSEDHSIVEKINASSTNVTGGGSNTITIDPSNNFNSDTKYYVHIDSDAFVDTSNNYYEGISLNGDFNFKTITSTSSSQIDSSEDNIKPSLIKTSPEDNSTIFSPSENIVLNFSEIVKIRTGNIYIKDFASSNIFETIDVQSGQVSGTRTNEITINPSSDLASNTKYFIQIDASAFSDQSNNFYSGITNKDDLNFTTFDIDAPIISGPSGRAGDLSTSKSIQENNSSICTFDANEEISSWSIDGVDASLFEIKSSGSKSATLSFINAPDYEKPTDNDGNNKYILVVRAIDADNNNSEQTITVSVTDVGEKQQSDDKHYKLSYKKTDDSIFSPTFGTINGAVTLNKTEFSPTIENKSSDLLISKTGINFELLLGNSSINNKGKTTTDLDPLLDGLTTTGKNIAYFSYTDLGDGSAPIASTLTYDPVKKAGARFYDLRGDGSAADTVILELVDGGYGDKDGVKNGIIVDPSTVGVVDLNPVFTSSSTALTVADTTDTTSPAAFNLSVSISSNASTVNQIGYVALNSNESDTLTYDLIKNRGSILLSNVENSGAPNLSGMDLTADISLINTQKLVFFEVVDTTLESLLSNNTDLDGFGSSFKILNLSDTTRDSAYASNEGNTIAISLQKGFSGVNDLISSDLGFNPILDFSGFAGLSLEGSVSVAREAIYDSTVGFYKIQNSNGAVTDPTTGDLITPDETGYKEAALHSTNLFSSLDTLSTSNGNTIKSSITSFSDSEMIAPYASVHDTGQTYFSFTEANADGISHFREFGNGVIGLEDLYGGGDNDFDDLIFGFDLKLTF